MLRSLHFTNEKTEPPSGPTLVLSLAQEYLLLASPIGRVRYSSWLCDLGQVLTVSEPQFPYQ